MIEPRSEREQKILRTQPPVPFQLILPNPARRVCLSGRPKFGCTKEGEQVGTALGLPPGRERRKAGGAQDIEAHPSRLWLPEADFQGGLLSRGEYWQ